MTDYYNEFDPYVADCLENLIRDGLIPHGIVDRRSIEDVAPSDLADFNRCHFFAGIGGWPLALSLAGFHDRSRRLWTGSCPCQPFSAAGAGGGFDDERHLWPHFHWLIENCRPEIVLGEQVASKDGLGWIDLVSSDLEGSGYACGAVDLCAAGFSASHIRQRLYWIGLADTDDTRSQGRWQPGRERTIERALGARGVVGGMGHTERGISGRLPGEAPGTQAQGGGIREPGDHRLVDAGAGIVGLEHATGDGRIERGSEPSGRGATSGCGGSGLGHAELQQRPGTPTRGDDARGWQQKPTETSGLCGGSGLADAARQQCDGSGDGRSAGRVESSDCCDHDWTGTHDGDWRVADWLYCRDEKWRPVEPGTFPLVDGLPKGMGTIDAGVRRMAEVAGLDGTSLRSAKSYRVGALKGYGNALDIHTAAEFCHAVKKIIES